MLIIKKYRLVGVTYDNDDGTNRQYLLRKLKYKEDMFASAPCKIYLKKYTFNDEPAISVTADGYQLGNLSKEDAKSLCNMNFVQGVTIEIFGGGQNESGEKMNFGAEITVSLEASDFASEDDTMRETISKNTRAAIIKSRQYKIISFILLLLGIVIIPVCIFSLFGGLLKAFFPILCAVVLFVLSGKIKCKAENIEDKYRIKTYSLSFALKFIGIIVCVIMTCISCTSSLIKNATNINDDSKDITKYTTSNPFTVVNADTLCGDYSYDNNMADDYYKGKTIHVEGIVSEINRALNEPYIVLEVAAGMSYKPMCYYPSGMDDELRGIAIGSTVKISGTVEGLVENAIILYDCETLSFTRENEPYITLDEYNMLRPGMTYEECCELIGSLGNLTYEYTSSYDNVKHQTYSFDGNDTFENAFLRFENGKLESKSQFYLE